MYNTDLVGQTQPTKKPLHWVAIKLDDNSPIVILEVNDRKDNTEIVGWYTLDERNLERIKRQANKDGGELIVLSPKDKVVSLPTPLTDLPSGGKVTEKNNSAQQGSKETDKAEGTDDGKSKKFSPDTKIDDVGERLEGARKDMRRKIAESLANVTEYPATASCPTGFRRPLLLFPPFLSFPHRLDTALPPRNFRPLFLGSRSFQLSLQQIQAPDYLVPPRLVRKCVDSQGLFLWGSRSFPLSL